ncbi:hypothetical protein PU560_17000 [Georgenia sp. 10Sc9-8]|uniref:Uncharacterized protein n=1 Tax=Georgenia halotolerans TaxID=3028317 RepID=A0ABT5U3U5_9MICO|nr:hypothetical protein [Georgenia halotolerans]
MLAQAQQEPGGHGVDLADVSEGEGPQEGAQRRGGVAAVEDLAHGAVVQQGHVLDAVRARGHARYQRGELQPGVGALVTLHTQLLVGQLTQPRLAGQSHLRDQACGRHEVGSSKVADTTPAGVRKLHLRDALRELVIRTLDKSHLPRQKGISAFPRLSTSLNPSVDRG